MNVPDNVKVGGITYSVKLANVVSEENPEVDGMILYHKQEIRLKRDMPREYTEKTFWHELLHGILDFCAIERQEEQVKVIGNVLYQVLKDNGFLKE